MSTTNTGSEEKDVAVDWPLVLTIIAAVIVLMAAIAVVTHYMTKNSKPSRSGPIPSMPGSEIMSSIATSLLNP